MFLRSARNGGLCRTLTWRRIIGAGGDQPGETQRGFELIKYVSPTWNGFTAAGDFGCRRFLGRDAALPRRDRRASISRPAAGYLDLVPGSRSRGVCALTLFSTATGDASKCRAGGRLGQRAA